MSGVVNTIVKNHFEVDLNFHPIRVIRFRNSDPGKKFFFQVLLERVTKVNVTKIFLGISTFGIYLEKKFLSGATQPKKIKIGHVKEKPQK